MGWAGAGPAGLWVTGVPWVMDPRINIWEPEGGERACLGEDLWALLVMSGGGGGMREAGENLEESMPWG